MSEATPGGSTVVLPPKKSRTGRLIALIVVVVAVIVAAVLIGVNATAAKPAASTTTGAITTGLGSPATPVKIGVVDASEAYWATFSKAALAKGISVSIVNFATYPQPNPALTAGELDLNQFQHIIYLAAYNKSAKQDLTPIGSTAIYPLGLYSTKYKKPSEIPAGSTVAIPNDPANLARGLLVLQSAGLVELTGGGSPFSKLSDVNLEKSKVKVVTLEASLTPTSLPDVAAAIINNNFVKNANLTAKDAIAQDDVKSTSSLPYVNLFVSSAKNKSNPVLLKLVAIYQDTQAVLDGVSTTSGDTAIFLKTPVKDLVTSLAKVEKETPATN